MQIKLGVYRHMEHFMFLIVESKGAINLFLSEISKILYFAFSNARASMGPSGVSFACHAVDNAFEITTANFDEITDKHQHYGVPKR